MVAAGLIGRVSAGIAAPARHALLTIEPLNRRTVFQDSTSCEARSPQLPGRLLR
jgi:hypothetical protein